ncbi:MAG TPA: SGNH/GDSL hydrolase family protein [Oligoflexia bacterium]|nr:SGNH/GDSL hydrolase family protein [Oligoflexia bacterium]HMP26567.1 SGNH/GDSL hydrolase family protein [Oligoflexia bacterium]
MYKRVKTVNLLIALLVPTLVLLLLEAVCRVLRLDQNSLETAKVVVDLPRWMQEDLNLIERSHQNRMSNEEREWLSIFESGDGFRARLIPEVERRVINTFSLLPTDYKKPYLVVANKLGFRGPDLKNVKEPGMYRVLVFGDSSSYGWGVDFEDSYSFVLTEKLKEAFAGRKIELGNFAIPGDSSEYGRLIFDKFAPIYKPDLVVISFGANDAKPSYVAHVAQVDRFRRAKAVRKALSYLEYSALFRSLKIAFEKAPQIAMERNHPPRQPAVSKSRYAYNIQAMIKDSRRYGAEKVLVLSLCSPGHYSRAAKNTATSEGALYFNGQSYLESVVDKLSAGLLEKAEVDRLRSENKRMIESNKKLLVTSDLCHPNKIGHKLIAEELLKLITENNQAP